MNKRAFFALGCIALGFFSFLITGCNPPTLDTVPVSGKITVDGQPIPQGVIIFHAADGQTASGGGAIENGVYKAEVPLGKKNRSC